MIRKKVLAVAVAWLFMLTTSPRFIMPLEAQGYDYKTKQIVATDFNQWTSYSPTTVAAGSATITLDPAIVTIPGWTDIVPFVLNSKLLVDTGSVQEVVTISSASCTSPTNCTITASFAYAHSGRYPIKSGSYGLQEAINFTSNFGGGAVVVPTGFAGTTADLTAAYGATTVSINDVRQGASAWYAYTGTAYAANEDFTTINGAALQIVSSSWLFSPTTATGLTTSNFTQIGTIPAGAIMIALTADVTTTIPSASTGITSWNVKDRSNPVNTFASTLALTSGTKITGVTGTGAIPMRYYASATGFDATATTANFPGTGAIRFTAYFIKTQAPSN